MEKVKMLISNKTFIKILLSIFIIIVSIFYFKAFFTPGVYYNDIFLKKQVKSSEKNYTGKSVYGKIVITVKGSVNRDSNIEVIYNLPNNISRYYIVSFKDTNASEQGIPCIIKDKDGNIVFEGMYVKDSPFLYNTKWEPVINSSSIRVVTNGETSYDQNYTVDLKNAADFAASSKDTIRGKYQFLFIAILLFAITIIDVKFPLFFFSLKHFMDVKDPEPSDLYITMQKISWYAYPIIGIILLIAAI